jgi:hypothetical protein
MHHRGLQPALWSALHLSTHHTKMPEAAQVRAPVPQLGHGEMPPCQVLPRLLRTASQGAGQMPKSQERARGRLDRHNGSHAILCSTHNVMRYCVQHTTSCDTVFNTQRHAILYSTHNVMRYCVQHTTSCDTVFNTQRHAILCSTHNVMRYCVQHTTSCDTVFNTQRHAILCSTHNVNMQHTTRPSFDSQSGR